MAIFRCKMCGGDLIVNGESVATCEYCNTKQTLPKLDDKKRLNLYDRANQMRRNNEFDKAMKIYEQILDKDENDAEAYWSLVLCRYGIEYVEDYVSKRRVPTVNRVQYTSIFDDSNYKMALKYADSYQKSVYQEEAKVINDIQKGILLISEKEKPFDVFICYKETDNFGRRTKDSVLAQELYHELTKEGFKVFFSRITLEDKLGTAYEPYIFAALNSSKVMVVVGTKSEYFNAVWVKNEWSRYLALIKNGAKKMLIPAYRDMDPYDLPEEFSHLQAQDMSKLGFMQDLIRGIKKIVKSNDVESVKKNEEVIVKNNDNVSALVKRIFMFLEDGDFKNADSYCERVLDMDPENGDAYLGKLMVSLEVIKKENLSSYYEDFSDNGNYKKIMRYGSQSLKDELKECISIINIRNENQRKEEIYQDGIEYMEQDGIETYRCAIDEFKKIIDYKDAKNLIEKCEKKIEIYLKEEEEYDKKQIYEEAVEIIENEYSVNKYLYAIDLLESIPNWKDSNELVIYCKNEIEKMDYDTEKNYNQWLKNYNKRLKIYSKIIIGYCIFVIMYMVIFAGMNMMKKMDVYKLLVGKVFSGYYYDKYKCDTGYCYDSVGYKIEFVDNKKCNIIRTSNDGKDEYNDVGYKINYSSLIDEDKKIVFNWDDDEIENSEESFIVNINDDEIELYTSNFVDDIAMNLEEIDSVLY